MLFAIGTKVRLRHTGDEGVITEVLGNGILAVMLIEEETEVPVFEEDLVRTEEYLSSQATAEALSPLEPEMILYAKEQKNTAHTPNHPKGLWLAFDPDYDEKGLVVSYQVFLVNNTDYDFIYSVKVQMRRGSTPTTHGKISESSVSLLRNILYDQLNDAPVFDFACWMITTAGTGTQQQRSIKIKPKQFFKKNTPTPLLNRPTHLYQLILPDENKKTSSSEDLKTYTKKKVKTRPSVSWEKSHYQIHDVHEYASFSGEIDLHLEKITTRAIDKMTNAEKLKVQLQHFEAFIDKAIRLGVPRVYVIHGLGKGKLKNIIASRLIQMKDVKTFKNEYHPKYGWGATEVIFED